MGRRPTYTVFYGYPMELFSKICKDLEEDYDETSKKLFECGDFLIAPYYDNDYIESMYIGLDLFNFDWDYGIEEYKIVEKPAKHSLYFLIQNAPEEYKDEVRKVIEDNEPKLYHYCDYW